MQGVASKALLSLHRDGTLGLTLDPQLIRDLTVLITSSTVRCQLDRSVGYKSMRTFAVT